MDREEPHLSLFGRIRSLKEQHRYSEAEEEIQRELEKKPEQPFLKATLADLFLHQNRLAEARILIDEILSRDPQHPQALYLLGEIFLKRNSPKEALECFRQAFAREPRDYLILRSARALKEMNRFAEALEELEKVLVVKPKNFPFLREKGLVLNKMKRFDQALEAFERAKEIFSGDSFVNAEILRLRSRERPGGRWLRSCKRSCPWSRRKTTPRCTASLPKSSKKPAR